MSDLKEIICIAVGVLVLVVTGVLGLSCAAERSEHEACRTFCEDFGETAYYAGGCGCFCVTSDGKRYNPDTLTKEVAP